MYIKTMHLCNAQLRAIVNLLDYEWEITKCILKILPDALVEVKKSFFAVMTAEPQTDGEARRIGKLMGQTTLGVYTREHFYKSGYDDSLSRSGKIFIEARNPKGKIRIDEAQIEINAALAEMSEDRPVQEQRVFADISIEQLEREAPPLCECGKHDNQGA